MAKRFRLFYEQLALNPRKLFLVDSAGALLTAFLTGVILVMFRDFFGMPKRVLIVLSLTALLFAVYSLSCYFFSGGHWRICLRVIAIANLLYCCATAGLVIFFYSSLSIFGVLYFVGEILLVGILVSIEWRSALPRLAEKHRQ
ncbi:MAG: hypothetical protein JNJ86_07920 [Chitinophagaceae bacterium]|nr:hypothetical protein [Chitinophagaceae bacterium]